MTELNYYNKLNEEDKVNYSCLKAKSFLNRK